MNERQQLGRSGEDLASTHLTGEGFAIVERNFRTRWGEIDLIARRNGEYYFIEVKTRSDDRFGTPLEAMTATRLKRLQKMSLHYISLKRLHNKTCHISLLGIDLSGYSPRVEMLEDIVA